MLLSSGAVVCLAVLFGFVSEDNKTSKFVAMVEGTEAGHSIRDRSGTGANLFVSCWGRVVFVPEVEVALTLLGATAAKEQLEEPEGADVVFMLSAS